MGSEPDEFEHWSTNNTCRLLARRSALLRKGKGQWNEEDQSFMIEMFPASSTNVVYCNSNFLYDDYKRLRVNWRHIPVYYITNVVSSFVSIALGANVSATLN